MQQRGKVFLTSIILFLAFGCWTGDVSGHGTGTFSEFSMGRTSFNYYDEVGLKRNFIIGWNFDANVSTDRIFHYQISLGLGYVNVSQAISKKDYYEWDNHRISDPFNDAGYTIHMRHHFGWALWRGRPWRVMLGPYARFHYDHYTENPRSNWYMNSVGGGIQLGCRYDLTSIYTLELSMYGEISNFSSSEVESGAENAFGLRLGLLKTRERIEKEEQESDLPAHPKPVELFEDAESPQQRDEKEERERAFTETERTSEKDMAEQQVDRFKAMVIYDFSETGQRSKAVYAQSGFVIETFPGQCTIVMGDKQIEKQTELLKIEKISPGGYDLEFSWRGMTLRTSLMIETGREFFVSVSFPTRNIIIKSLYQGRFIVYDNGTIEDIKSNLMWLDHDPGQALSWAHARKTCEDFSLQSMSDWRLPTLTELGTLLVPGPHRHDKDKGLPGRSVLQIFRLSHSQLWSITQGDISIVIAEKKTYYLDWVKGRTDWTMTHRRMGVLPVRWIRSRALPRMEKDLDSIRNDLKQSRVSLLERFDYVSVNEENFAREVFGSDFPVVVFFHEPWNEGGQGLASVYEALARAYKDVLKFCVYEVPRDQVSFLKPRYYYTSPASIIIFGEKYGQKKQLDTFDDDFSLVSLWRQRFELLSLWLHSQLLDSENGIYHRGQYNRITFFNE